MLSLPAKKSEAYKRTSVEIRIHSKSAEKRRRSLALCLVLAIFAAETDRGMKSVRRCLPLLALLLLAGSVTSCRDTSCRDALQHAEALMESDPHAARAVLDSLNLQSSSPISNSSFLIPNYSKRDVADLAWLKVQADYKCDVPLTTDSLARIATNYYGMLRRKNYHAAMAWYTLGCAYGDMKDDVNATDAFLKAKSLFPDTLIRYYALTEQKLGTHHLNRHMIREAAHEFQSAKQNLIRLEDSTAVAFLDLSLARCCLYREDYASARECLERVLQNPHASQYVFTVAHFEMAKVEIYYNHDYPKAHEYLDYDIRHTLNKNELVGNYCLKAIVFQEQEKLDSAWHYYQRSLECKSSPATFSNVYRQMAILAPRLGKVDSIAYYVRGYHIYIDSLYIISNQQAIRQVENDHRVELHDRELALQRSRFYWTWGILFVFLVFIASMIILLNDRRHKASALNYEQQLKDIERRYIQENAPDDEEDDEADIEADIEADVEADDEPAVHTDLPVEEIPSATSWFSLQEKRLTLYRNQYLASKWPGYFISHQADVEKKELMSPADSEQFLQYLSELFVNMMVDLYRESGHLNRSDMEFCCMTMLGFDANQIAYCCRKPVKYSYNRRTRLAERLTAEWYQFIFGKPSRQA